jgi:hypothetical protein
MGQMLHGSAKTTYAIRTAIQRSNATIAGLADKSDLNPKTVMKSRQLQSVEDMPTGPNEPLSTIMSVEEEAHCIAFRKHTLLPLDDCLYALQATIPHLTRSSLHRLFQRHDISRLPEVEGKGSAEQSSEPIRSATFTSTSRRCAQKKASSTCSWPLIAFRSSRSWSFTSEQHDTWRQSF